MTGHVIKILTWSLAFSTAIVTLLNKHANLSLTASETTLQENAKGLELVLNAEIPKYIPISETEEFRIVIHDASEEPDPERKGMNIIPGYENLILHYLFIFFLSKAP
ncbi:hypothetical protein TNCV_2506571 [Trichonephila clavipes]|uniref:Uncharacterized protein n=1 Tax=Trichonephila clavipes TaxID=2585209 RepID=A0A8X7BL74_TRICX|nr:hypothetical protein TNCV_2506571 [Trichonephila clavipes]